MDLFAQPCGYDWRIGLIDRPRRGRDQQNGPPGAAQRAPAGRPDGCARYGRLGSAVIILLVIINLQHCMIWFGPPRALDAYEVYAALRHDDCTRTDTIWQTSNPHCTDQPP
jgi:hypothetical protein